jgi:peptide-methionine (R)-S-oxide reductase
MKSNQLWMGSLLAVAVAGVVLASVATRPQTAALSATESNGRSAATQWPLAPELTGGAWLNTPDKKPITLASRRGKVTIVEFWTFGCSNCQANLPSYARWQKKFADKDVTIIGVHTPETAYESDPKNVARRVKELGITYPVLLDADNENWNRWHQQYWPTVYLVDKAGRIRRHWEGELNWNGAGGEANLSTVVEQLLKEPASSAMSTQASEKGGKVTKVVKTDAEWKKILTPAQFDVLRREGTEYPFSHEFKVHDKGVFRCVACGLDLFTSDTKFESGTGWPSFYQPIKGHVTEKTDADGMRTEVRCARCDGHLGHVFDDGPKPTGLRYCMNGVVLKFEKTP